MYFIYPAAISENCDKKIAVAACKCMERFFLTQILDAFQSGNLRAKQEYNDSKKVYGPVVLEGKRNLDKSKKYITESKFLMEKTHGSSSPAKRGFDASDMMDELDSCAYHDNMSEMDMRINKAKIERIRGDAQSQRNSPGGEAMDDVIDKANKYLYEYEQQQKILDRERNKSTVGGSYKPLKSTVDIIPTSAEIRIPIAYVDGPKDGDEKDYPMVIGVKVMPFIMKNFKRVETALLDDYFSRVAESGFKSIARSISRTLLNTFHKIIDRLPLIRHFMNAKVDNEQDDVRDTIYGPSGFVNASAFRSNRNSPSNYHYSSNIVIFNKDDLSDPEDYNIFANRSAMNRLFTMGWSTFAVLDPIEEEMTFISSLDGGYMHKLPYAYIFETIGSKVMYNNKEKLKQASSPFYRRAGNFYTFAKQFND